MALSSSLGSTPLRYRRDAARLTPGQARDISNAYAGMMALVESDERSYMRFAGTHGLPNPSECQHETPLFLPWHRAFLYFFERAMRDRVPAATLPWWNWATAPGQVGTIPSLFGDRLVAGAANPLYSAEISPRALQDGQRVGSPAPGSSTMRTPGIGGRRLPPAPDVAALVEIRDFTSFNRTLEELHGQIHLWTGGHMGYLAWAGFDPIFWAHHAMVDRLWRLWQIRHNAPGPSPDLWSQPLPPFAMNVGQTLDVTQLGYDYVSSSASQQIS